MGHDTGKAHGNNKCEQQHQEYLRITGRKLRVIAILVRTAVVLPATTATGAGHHHSRDIYASPSRTCRTMTPHHPLVEPQKNPFNNPVSNRQHASSMAAGGLELTIEVVCHGDLETTQLQASVGSGSMPWGL